MDDPRHRTGVRGELLAAAYLRRNGARVLERNVVVPDGEVDLIVELAGQRIAVEVRTRWYEDPLDAFDGTKLERVRRSATRLSPPSHRVDLVTIRFDDEGAHIRWTPNL